ncbi:MAG TPA: glutaredoxin family protein [Polyangiaceae bacterium]|nr:glutaredoxin family protein [Polyangiaceae bacterium]
MSSAERSWRKAGGLVREALRARKPEALRARKPEALRARKPEALRARKPEALRGKLMVGVVSLILGVLVGLGGCHKNSAEAHDDHGSADPGSAAPKSATLPPLVLKADTPNLLLTWIDEQGDFHVVDKTSDVPAEARKTVRVVVTDREAGTGEQVYVANLSAPATDGSFSVTSMSRAAWDELGATKRKARLEALAPPPPSALASAAGSAPSAKPAASSVVVIIYGASWCKPCHDAESYLKRRGVNVVKKDIEESEVAANEMRAKLERAGKGGASIPVIDIGGRLLVGFSPAAIEKALETARTKTL